MNKLEEITKGWYNYLTQNSTFKPIAEERAKVCSDCKLNINSTCSKTLTDKCVNTFEYGTELRIEGNDYTGCGCPLAAKTFSPNTQCPLNKWSK